MDDESGEGCGSGPTPSAPKFTAPRNPFVQQRQKSSEGPCNPQTTGSSYRTLSPLTMASFSWRDRAFYFAPAKMTGPYKVPAWFVSHNGTRELASN